MTIGSALLLPEPPPADEPGAHAASAEVDATTIATTATFTRVNRVVLI
jgi:hypothetical protein